MDVGIELWDCVGCIMHENLQIAYFGDENDFLCRGQKLSEEFF